MKLKDIDWAEVSMTFLAFCFGAAVLLVGISMLILALNMLVPK